MIEFGCLVILGAFWCFFGLFEVLGPFLVFLVVLVVLWPFCLFGPLCWFLGLFWCFWDVFIVMWLFCWFWGFGFFCVWSGFRESYSATLVRFKDEIFIL